MQQLFPPLKVTTTPVGINNYDNGTLIDVLTTIFNTQGGTPQTLAEARKISYPTHYLNTLEELLGHKITNTYMTAVIANLYLYDDNPHHDKMDHELTAQRAPLFIRLNTLWLLNNSLQKMAATLLTKTILTPPELGDESPVHYTPDTHMHTNEMDYMETKLTRLVPTPPAVHK